MTTEKFKETAETFEKNVNNTMKWLQDITSTIIETQNKQMKSASDMYNKAMNTTLGGINKENFNSSFGVSETMVEVLQKNIESISNMSKAAMKTALEFGKQASSESFSKEKMTSIIESYKKQAEEIAAWNKKSFETFTKQFDTAKADFAPWAEKFKTEFDANVKLSKEKTQAIVDSYTKIVTPTVEANKELFNKLNNQINESVNANLKLWSELMSAQSTKGFDAKTMSDFFKTATNGSITKNKQSVKA